MSKANNVQDVGGTPQNTNFPTPKQEKISLCESLQIKTSALLNPIVGTRTSMWQILDFPNSAILWVNLKKNKQF